MTCRHDLWSNDVGNDNTSSKTTGLEITNMTCLANTVSSHVPNHKGSLDNNYQIDLDNEHFGFHGFAG